MLYSQTKGNGSKTIFFLHGNSQSIELWNDVINNEKLKDYTLITIDLPGHGKSFISEQPDKDYSLPGMAAHIKEFILQRSDKEYIIIANSLSTCLVGEIAHLLINCKGLFLTGPNIIGENILVSDILQPNPNVTPLFTISPTDEAIDNMINEGSYNISENNKRKCKEDFKNTDPVFREQLFASLSRQEWSDEIKNLSELAAPVAIVCGEEDRFINAHYLDRSSLQKWKDKIILIPKAGHLLQYDQPEVLTELIKEFAIDCFK
ncbi:MAG TPA: alpha/beta hydrolase [Ferruginibacter sp.]|jgi:pimeloyl-ACP methyl ester carboxylesterase|nr:alpha/beta hydrolase [Ferruginibacter sp.]